MEYFITDTEIDRNVPMCKEIGSILTDAYPGHSWHVRIDGGMLVIKSLKVSVTACMAVRYSQIAHDASRRKREVIMKAGEFLEACNLRRGRFQGESPRTMEGLRKGLKFKGVLPEPSQPNSLKIVDEYGRPVAVLGENPDV